MKRGDKLTLRQLEETADYLLIESILDGEELQVAEDVEEMRRAASLAAQSASESSRRSAA